MNRKTLIPVLCLVLLVVVSGILYAVGTGGESSAPASQAVDDGQGDEQQKKSTASAAEDANSQKASGPLMVDDLRNKPGRFTEVISVLGVVGRRNTEHNLLGLIDKEEVEECGTIHCPEFLLPVRWRKTMPAKGATVVVRGKLEKASNGFVLAAERIKEQ